MSSTTGEHINELEERRRRRQERNAARPGPAKPPRSANTALEARDLLRDLITNGSRPEEGTAGHLDPNGFGAPEAIRSYSAASSRATTVPDTVSKTR